jgi:hypothetical protein
MISRRDFSKAIRLGLLALAAGGSLTLTGCSPLVDYLTEASTGVDSIFTLLGIASSNPIRKDVDAAFGSAIAAANEYEADRTVGTGKLVSALDALNTALKNFLAQADIPSPLVAVILSAVSIVISTIEGWLNSLGKSAMVSFQLNTKAGQPVTIAPKKRNAREFKRDWDAAVASQPSLVLK